MKISRILITTSLLMGGIGAKAQLSLGGHFYGEDAFKFSESKITGSARMQGLGGGYVSLGADATNNYTNPAGLGFYNRSELSITPVFNSINVGSVYAGSAFNKNTSNASIGQLGLIISNGGVGTRKKRSAFAITYSKQNNFLTDFRYKGLNQRSSMMDYFAEKATRRGADSGTLDNEYDPNSGYASSSEAMYYQAYLIDPVSGSGAPYRKLEPSLPVEQTGDISNTGSTSQWNLGYGINFDDKTYIGLGIGFVRLNYENVTTHSETFPSGVIFNGFDYSENLYVRGTGVNFSLGTIYKATENVSLGASVTTPSWISVNEIYNSNITISPKSGNGVIPSSAVTSVSTDENSYTYSLATPLKASGGATFFFPNKAGFITADAEYIGYRGMGVKDSQDKAWSDSQKRGIQSAYNDVVNVKVGAEYRIQNIRVRAGAKYMPDPYKQKLDNLNRSQMLFTGGLGYRSGKFFIDLAGVFNQFKGAYTPYQLSNAQNYGSASLTSKATNFVVSVGTFF
ncbi:OmpP1/FadL family transporter [Emticicia sp. 17c]|uniref:OmpP1/FadL family transporter n=1 Tax=Emticicia sp. 17c TaxID=3127704 RepID=UPI00301B9E35